MPKMGESVSEATIISWNKNIGDMVELDETIIEIATDKVDSEVPSTHEGKLVEMLFAIDDVVQVGEPFAIIESAEKEVVVEEVEKTENPVNDSSSEITQIQSTQETIVKPATQARNSGEKFYSPLVRSMASQEGIEMSELETISGTGKGGQVTKSDMLSYLESRVKFSSNKIDDTSNNKEKSNETESSTKVLDTGNTEIVEMDRMRKLISAHMTMSKQHQRISHHLLKLI